MDTPLNALVFHPAVLTVDVNFERDRDRLGRCVGQSDCLLIVPRMRYGSDGVLDVTLVFFQGHLG